ncbi:hypothetical protein BCV70DRAFT_102711 [Testicularia cyperi]|uniref:Uncharacterized protein n=1 Tax=Testicularia cyperi TaxID=1882483 RepID=A0A317XRF1_9BASI|nr:hypothetical protein BCV70DRAFT_102711 [Testicularia cyperi]
MRGLSNTVGVADWTCGVWTEREKFGPLSGSWARKSATHERGLCSFELLGYRLIERKKGHPAVSEDSVINACCNVQRTDKATWNRHKNRAAVLYSSSRSSRPAELPSDAQTVEATEIPKQGDWREPAATRAGNRPWQHGPSNGEKYPVINQHYTHSLRVLEDW